MTKKVNNPQKPFLIADYHISGIRISVTVEDDPHLSRLDRNATRKPRLVGGDKG